MDVAWKCTLSEVMKELKGHGAEGNVNVMSISPEIEFKFHARPPGVRPASKVGSGSSTAILGPCGAQRVRQTDRQGALRLITVRKELLLRGQSKYPSYDMP